MPKFLKCPEEVHALAREILCAFDTHRPLLDARVKIDLLFALADTDEAGNVKGDALKLHGRKCLGIARRIKLKDRVMGRGDCEVTLDGDWWATATEADQRGLLDHELHHFTVELDSNGKAVTDDITRPLILMRKHDFEFGWFEVIALRHGKHSQEVQQAIAMMAKSGKVLLQTSFDFQPLEMDVNEHIDFTPAVADLLKRCGNEVHIDAKGAANIIKTCDAILNENQSAGLDEDEDLIQQCIEVIKSEQKASVSLLQQRLRLGYTRSARIMDELEGRGIVGPAKGTDPRDILIDLESKPEATT